MVTVAIIGSGPAGCYTAQFLRKRRPDAEITIFDRLPVPFGLVRYGVAPDHQGTKAVTRQFDRLFEREGVRFAGNVEVGVDLSVAELEEAYDVVVVATGLDSDRRLGIPGDDHPLITGAGRIVRQVNGHPDAGDDVIRIGRRVVVIGNGNVAIDVLRMLLKPLDAFTDSDVDDHVLAELRGGGLEHIDVVGRSPIDRAKFDPVFLRELKGLPGVRFEVDEPVVEDSPVADVVRGLVAESDREAAVSVSFRFGYRPVAVVDTDQGCAVSFAAADARELTLAADSVITAIGFEHGANRLYPHHAPGAETISPAPRTYRTGWYRRGPRGTIPENRVDAREVADVIADDIDAGVVGVHRRGWAALPSSIEDKAVDFEAWRAIDAVEVGRARADRARHKITDREELLRIAADAALSVQGKTQEH